MIAPNATRLRGLERVGNSHRHLTLDHLGLRRAGVEDKAHRLAVDLRGHPDDRASRRLRIGLEIQRHTR